MILFDDIGSYPLPEGIDREWVRRVAKNNDPEFFKILKDAMRQKIDVGIDIPSYPQFQDMNQQFLGIINDESKIDEPFVVRKENAVIMELSAIEEIGAEYYKKNGKKLRIRVCVTGPVELYLKQFGGTTYTDILESFAESIDRFVGNSIDNAENLEIYTISIDEPSIGINPQVMFNDNDLVRVLEKATRTAAAHKIDTEIHLHSPLHYTLICNVPSIGIIGVESAANPSYLDLIDKKDLIKYDKFLRIGISRTDIFNMTSVLNEKYRINVWKEPSRLKEIVTDMETPATIRKRLMKAYAIFGDRIRYAGPDCGLGSWPSQEMASVLLANTGRGIKEFLKTI